MDYADFFDRYAFLKRSVMLLEQGFQEIEKKSPLRKSFKKEIQFQKGLIKSLVKQFAKKFASTSRAFARLGEEEQNFLLKKMAKHHELCVPVAPKLVNLFFARYHKATPEQQKIWIKLVSTKEICSYLFNHSKGDAAIKYVADTLKKTVTKKDMQAMCEALKAVFDALPDNEVSDEQRVLMRTFAIE